MIVTPGFIDLHVHLREPGQEHKEDIASGTRAAAAGGFTTIFCMPNTKPVNDSAAVTTSIVEKAKAISPIHVIPVGALTEGSAGTKIADIAGMMGEGAGAFSDDGACVQDARLMKEAVYRAKNQGALIIDHAEDFSITGAGRVNEGEIAQKLNVPGIPREAENAIIRRDIDLARETGAHIHIAHLSTVEAAHAIREAKADGVSITCEVTPHHLLLKDADVERYGPNAIMKPPLRGEEDRQALIAGLADGTIDAIATDHAPHATDEKKDLESCAFGVIGMETMLSVCLALVHDGSLAMERLIDALTRAPARVAGLDAGTLTPGAPADITIFDPEAPITIDASTFNSKSRNTPFDGWRCQGRVMTTIARGDIVHRAK